ncbi:MAG: YmdB family metallophosphoesterase, partial [Proteobacteria bacterium]|nr:YmdB family metallophosphoesterase [Pseudomonadota bacterium]
PGTPGNYQFIGETSAGTQVAVVNLQGRVFMPIIDCPFQLAEREIPKLARQTSSIIIDFHAEATSEKVAFGWFMNGKVSAVLGTHTHIPTADARVLPEGTAYISDVGMTGPMDSVIGVEKERIIQKFLTGVPAEFKVAKGRPTISAVLIETDDDTGKARSIQRVSRCEAKDRS